MNQGNTEQQASGVAATVPAYQSHASAVLYPAIKAAMQELETFDPGFNAAIDRAYDHLHAAFWSECPAPADAPALRAVPAAVLES